MLNNDLRLPGTGRRLKERAPGLVSRILGTIAGVALVAGTIALSVFVFFAVAMAAIMVGGYLWWKTRALRRQLREQPPRAWPPVNGRVIEGEVIRDPEQR